MYRYIAFSILFLIVFYNAGYGQGTVYGFKGGPSLAMQTIDGFSQRDPLWAYHGALFIESLPEENNYALYTQVGYHLKGSTIRTQRFTDLNGNVVRGQTYPSKFHNISWAVGAKQKFRTGGDSRIFYLLGLRMDVNIANEIELFENAEKAVKPVTWGFSAGGGYEFQFSEYIGGMIEISVAPDFSNQIYLPPQRDPWNPNRTIPESNVRNVVVEVSFGLRFLRKVVYID
jgi:hypothetical protein